MTQDQRRRTRTAIQRYGQKRGQAGPDSRVWAEAIQRTLDYYDEHDPLRADIMRIHYFEHRTEDETINRLHIGRTTYKNAQLDLLSTVAVYAAQHGAAI